ncbi:S-adenosyl-L-methionine-dependent methyltransferase [Phialemonium atrogriseum]|uniref:S-adenosyl-L-methionine-dependent methyltransferase n=1 Tax=Phialemonium atrogriseum TaxID=1093897 RepID=A0AAJ0C9U5_9PEZI|nr:S-adenosyl-L-methionine-dependent methyltransferase [Phialemonium atrogriseum]KAK1772630.1 S-adenosyl-L-methionine-dependent methyltransferase [Phialemonium atrogriseum]
MTPSQPASETAVRELSRPQPNGGRSPAGPADAPLSAYEREHVHGVYEAIAPHFSATRHKPWPLVTEFLRSQAPGSVGLDVGCGNGKYLTAVCGGDGGGGGGAGEFFMVGSDRSAALVGLARGRGRELSGDGSGSRSMAVAPEVLVADGLALPFREGAADFAICVAVIHHLSTRERRQDGVRQLLRCVRPRSGGGGGGGRVLVYVWALEQASSRRGWDEGGEQDLLVPWVMKKNDPRRGAAGGGKPLREGSAAVVDDDQPADQTFQRYYHLYRKGELEEDVRAVGGEVLSSGYERDNWWVIAANGTS